MVRRWLFYCIQKDAIFCFPCIIFNNNITQFNNKSCNVRARIISHKNSKLHKQAFITWQMYLTNLRNEHIVDDQLKVQMENECLKWRHILKVILDAVIFCAKSNNALRGFTEIIGHATSGKFLQTVEPISHYDPIIKQHTETHNKGKIT